MSRRGPEETTAAAGRQGVLVGGWKRGVTPPQKKFNQKFFFAKNSPDGATAAACRQGALMGG